MQGVFSGAPVTAFQNRTRLPIGLAPICENLTSRSTTKAEATLHIATMNALAKDFASGSAPRAKAA